MTLPPFGLGGILAIIVLVVVIVLLLLGHIPTVAAVLLGMLALARLC